MSARSNRVLEIVILTICSIGLALQFGFNYGISNQNTYLLGGLRLFDPTLLANDWLASKCTDFHPYFAYLVRLLYEITPNGWSFGIANFISILLVSYLIWLILGNFVDRSRQITVFVLIMALAATTGTSSVAGSYLISGIFQPSTMGSLGILTGIYFFSKRQFWISGISIALGCVFHINYLILSFPLFFTAHLIINERQLVRRLIQNLIPPLVIMLLFHDLLLAGISSPNSEQALWIFHSFRTPHHYLPQTFLTGFIPFIGWHILAVLTGWRLFYKNDEAKMLRGIWLANSALIIASAILSLFVYVPVVTQMLFSRLAPISVLIAQLAAIGGTFDIVCRESKIVLNKFTFAAALLAVLSIYGIHAWSSWPDLKLTSTILVILLALTLFKFTPFARIGLMPRYHSLAKIIVIVLGVAAIIYSARDFKNNSSLLVGLPQNEAELISWAEHSPLGSIFLIPPDLERFRLHTRRAIVVDFKSPPAAPDELLEWYARLQTVSGVDNLTKRSQLAAGYDSSVLKRIDALHDKYTFDFAIVNLPTLTEFVVPTSWEIVFTNEKFAVLEKSKT